jgi:hypothetical protein
MVLPKHPFAWNSGTLIMQNLGTFINAMFGVYENISCDKITAAKISKCLD